MIPDLIFIVATYTVLRLLGMILRQVYGEPLPLLARIGFGLFCGIGLLWVSFCTLDSVTNQEAQRVQNRRDFEQRQQGERP